MSVAAGQDGLPPGLPVWGPGAASVLASGGRPGSWGRPCRGKGVRAVPVRRTRRRGPRVGPRVRGGPANRARWANRGGAQYGTPAASPPGGLSCAPPLPVNSHPGGVARGARAEGARGTGPCPHAGAHKHGVGGGLTGRPFTTSRHRSSALLLELRAPPRPYVRRVLLSPLPSRSPYPLPGRNGYGFLAINGSGADRGDGLPKCEARHAGAEWDAGVGYGQVGQLRGGVSAGGRGFE